MNWSAIFKVLGVSAMPFLELRLGIPVGMANGLHPAAAISWGILGNLLQVPLAILLIWGLRRLATHSKWVARWSDWLDRSAAKHQEKARRYGWLGIAMFVGVPIPGTGLWTGAALASLLRLPLFQTVVALSLGVIMAGFLVGAVSTGAFSLIGE